MVGGQVDEKGYGSIIGTAALVLALLFSLSVFASSFEKSYDQYTNARNEQNTKMIFKVQTDLRIENVKSNGDNLVVTVKNTGSTQLNKVYTDLIIDGTFYPKDNIKKIVDNNQDTKIWFPGENLELTTDNIFNFVNTAASRVKVVSEYGISDYEDIEGVLDG